MSLVLWLPLTKDLRNQGLSDVTVTNNGATYSATDGKLGGCYSFDGSDDGIRLDGDIIPQLQTTDFSICFWTYSNDSGGRSIYIATTPASDWGFSIEKTSSEQLRVYWQGSPDYVASAFIIPNQEWCHIAVIIKDGNCYCYKNGEKVAERTYSDMTPAKLSRTWVYAQLGRDTRTGTTVLNGKMNDFRWYDHALSPMEVKQISQGLVLHYPLNNNGWGQENLVLNSDTFATGSGANGITPSTTSDGLHQVIASSGNSNWHASWATSTATSLLENAFAEGDPFTISFTIKSENANKTNPPTIYIKSGMGYYSMQGKIGPNWSTVYYSGTWKDTNSISFHLGFSGLVGTYLFKNWKVEKGLKPTPWCPNKNDELAITMGMNDGIEYDCSGFGNNGTRVGTFDWTSDTPKYQVSANFSTSNANYILISNKDYAIQGSLALTVSIWAYMEDWSTYNHRIYSCTEGGGFNIEFGNSYLQWAVNLYTNAEQTTSSYLGDAYITYAKSNLSSGWHMFTWIYTTNNTYLYVDGELKVTKTYTSYGLHFNTTAPLIIGGEATSNGGSSPYFDGKMSDFRIYATALSADDVLTLYNTAATIDNQGNLFTYEVVEG